MSKNIRNFCIISHIDHGKSTLADRMLEITGTVEKRKMREQFLDSMDIERERGITIKMTPVRMTYRPHRRLTQDDTQTNAENNQRQSALSRRESAQVEEYILNLIDTPGHIDFSYEVSRSLAAVEGAILLVDASQGIQAQTLTNIELAIGLGKSIIPAVNKIDLEHARIQETKEEIVSLLGCAYADILEISGKTGKNVEQLLRAIVERIPPPCVKESDFVQALIFDFEYSAHQGVIAYTRVFGGEMKKGQKLFLLQAEKGFESGGVGVFRPDRVSTDMLSAGEIGYVVTNIKEPSAVKVGDTITEEMKKAPALPGYREPAPVVWANIYPVSQDEFDDLKKALGRLHLTDSSFFFEEEAGALGRGFSCGFLGLLHIEIIVERMKREFNIEVVLTFPTVNYIVTLKKGETKIIHSPSEFPDDHEIEKVREPWIHASLIAPAEYMGQIFSLLEEYDALIGETENFGKRMQIHIEMPLRELMRDFYNRLKSVTSGYGSLDYAIIEDRDARVERIDVFVHEERVPAFSRITASHRVEREARAIVERLKKILPKQLFAYKVQARAHGRIIASEHISAFKKDVTGYLYGGDRTRKMKLWKKQKEGKKRLEESGSVALPHEVFIKMMRNE